MSKPFQIKRCPTCGSTKIKSVCKKLTRNYRGEEYTVPSVAYYECRSCDEHVYDRDAMRKIESYSLAFAHKLAAGNNAMAKAAW